MDLTEDDITWVKGYAAAATGAFAREFEAAGNRFKDGQVLLDQIRDFEVVKI